MTAKHSWLCSALPKKWWWLSVLISIPLLFYFMIADRQSAIENDLEYRVRQALLDNGVNWVDIELQQRGRDVMLKGKAPDETERERAIQLAAAVNGVRQVEHQIEILP